MAVKQHYIKNGGVIKTACGKALGTFRLGWTTRKDRVNCKSCFRSHEFSEATTPTNTL